MFARRRLGLLAIRSMRRLAFLRALCVCVVQSSSAHTASYEKNTELSEAISDSVVDTRRLFKRFPCNNAGFYRGSLTQRALRRKKASAMYLLFWLRFFAVALKCSAALERWRL